MGKKSIIFDFDGTIADTWPEVVKLINEHAHRYGLSPLRKHQISQIKKRESQAAYHALGVSRIVFWLLARHIRKELHERMPLVSPIKGMVPVLKELSNQYQVMGIVTSNTKPNVRSFLRIRGLSMFDFIISAPGFFHKSLLLRKALRRYHLTNKNTIYVGDETRDIRAAKEIGMRMVAVTWGFNTKKVLAEFSPDALVSSPRQLLNVLKRMK